MFRQSRVEKLKKNAINASELALQLAQDKKFRKRLLSALRHSSKAKRRARRDLGIAGAVRRIAADESVQSELKRARDDLQRARARLESKRSSHRLRKLSLFIAALASIFAVPHVRKSISALIAKAPKKTGRLLGQARAGSGPQSLDDLTKEELYARAQEADIPGRSEMSKEELVEALRAAR
jgi:hypothetical protein